MTAGPEPGPARVCAVIGSPVAHSLSPAIHNASFDELGLDWTFAAFDVPAGRASDAVDAMKTLGLAGYAVTTPLKEEMAATVDEVDPAAANLSSVNTVALRSDGTTLGASTDGAGFVASLQRAGIELAGARTLVLGAGGAARSIVDSLGRCEVAEIVVVNRTEAAAQRAVSLAKQARVGSASDLATAEIVVNATSVGMGDPECSPVAGDSLRPEMVVCDIVYHPLQTKLLRDAAAVGATTVDGLAMLVCQAQHQQRLWTGTSADYDTMRAAALAELLRR